MRWRVGRPQDFLKGRRVQETRPTPGQLQQAALSTIKGWAANPDGGGHNPGLMKEILAHDPACTSLRDIWMPRRTGKSCPSDLTTCHGPCGLTFYNEGLGMKFEDCPESWHYYCTCCAAKVSTCGCEPSGEA